MTDNKKIGLQQEIATTCALATMTFSAMVVARERSDRGDLLI